MIVTIDTSRSFGFAINVHYQRMTVYSCLSPLFSNHHLNLLSNTDIHYLIYPVSNRLNALIDIEK